MTEALPRRDADAFPRRDGDPLDLPDRRIFWMWVWSSVRPVVGWVLAALGALALLLGWYGVSGQALTAKQLPYLVSGGLTGIGLIILASVFLATEDVRHQLARLDSLERKIDELHALFVADLADPRASGVQGSSSAAAVAAPPGEDPAVMALPAGSSYHRPTCALVAGKAGAAPIDAAVVASRGLRPCRVCDPPAPVAA